MIVLSSAGVLSFLFLFVVRCSLAVEPPVAYRSISGIVRVRGHWSTNYGMMVPLHPYTTRRRD